MFMQPEPIYYHPQPLPHRPYRRHHHTECDSRGSYSGWAPSPSYADSAHSHSHARSPMRRAHTMGPEYHHHHPHPEKQQAAHTYAWVLEQRIAEMVRENEDTVRWVHQQKARDEVAYRVRRGPAVGRHVWPVVEEMLRADSAREHRTRRSEEWRREKEFALQEELMRLQAQRRDGERHRAAYEKRKQAEVERERGRREREREETKARREEAQRGAMDAYEERWAGLVGSTEPLTFRTIPWPVFSPPRVGDDVTEARVTAFVLSPLHPGETRRDKIRNALRRWHPDRFGRILARVGEDEKELVEDTVGTVARCLSDLLERESP